MSRSSDASKPSSANSSFEALRRIGELPFLAAVRDALPWSFVGLIAVFLVLLAASLLRSHPSIAALGLAVTAAMLPAFGAMSVVLAVALPLRYAARAQLSPIALVLGTVVTFALALPRPFGPSVLAYATAVGPTGLFLAMLAGGAVAFCAAILRRAAGPLLAAVLGALLAVGIFAVLLAQHISVAAAVVAALAPLAHLGDTYVALMIIVLVEMLLWSIGIHGPAMLAAVVTPVYLALQVQNTAAFSAHAPLPHIVVVSLFLFVFPGGAGATLPLAAWLAISRIPRLRRIGRLTLLPALINANEPLLFGAPVVFNPFLTIPFIVTPLVLATLTYVAVVTNVVSRPAFYVPSVIPVPIATYLATLDLRAVALVALNLIVAAIIYYPFVRASEHHLETA
jgi:PTS system cellobiose-specific IIC component